MSIELTLTNLIKPLNGNRVWQDTLPDGYVITDPVVILQQMGGDAFNYVENAAPSHKHARIQLTVWAKTRNAANVLARQLENAIAAANLVSQPYAAFTGLYENELKLYGCQQQYGFWYSTP